MYICRLEFYGVDLFFTILSFIRIFKTINGSRYYSVVRDNQINTKYHSDIQQGC